MGTHEIRWLDDGRILLLVVSGFWDDGEALAFEAAARRALAGRPPHAFHAVCDASGMAVQSVATQRRIQGLLAEMRSAGMTGGAMVVTSSLLRMQAARTVDTDRTRFFDSRSEALDWAGAQTADGAQDRV